ncbi:MAG TPA: FGGY family carbohydrate kinase [Sphingomonas sp.]|nr:FGGY family carbohydrate kinase [Sphingomonas sp.]
MPGGSILAIDQGTTNTKVLLFGADGSVIARSSRGVAIEHPRPGWAEQSAAALWRSVCEAIDDLLSSQDRATIDAIAISNQRETIVVWDAATGEPIAPAVTWQCRRSSERCAALRAAGHAAAIAELSGLALDPLFPAAKLAWLLDTIEGARALAAAGRLRAGTIDSWLIWKLTGGVHATDFSNASRTQVFDLSRLAWSEELAAIFDVPLGLLPEVRSSDSLFGRTVAGLCQLPGGIPVHAAIGDSHAALRAHGAAATGQAKVTCGTGSSVMIATPARVASGHGLSTTVAWAADGAVRFALEGNIAVSGHAAGFATRLLGLDGEKELTALAQTVPTSDGVVFLPALAGIGAPHWQDRARGLVSGLSLGTTPAHVARATFEGIALQIGDVVQAVEADLAAPLSALAVDGGAAANDFLVQMLADLIDRPVVRPDLIDASALGAACLAAAAIGFDEFERARSASRPERFEPAMDAATRGQIREQWALAIERARLGA